MQAVDSIQPRRVYGGRYKPLGTTRKAALRHLPEYEIKLNGMAPGILDPKTILNAHTVHLEIGSGTGEHLVHFAAQNPHELFLCAEPFIAGTAYLIKQIMEQRIENIRTYPDDGMAFLQALKASSVDHAYVLFPDPWPKNRHHVRRFIQRETLDELARTVRTGGTLLLATDDPGMLDWMLTHMLLRGDFCWSNTSLAECRTPPQSHIPSRYAQKALTQGKPLYYLSFTRA